MNVDNITTDRLLLANSAALATTMVIYHALETIKPRKLGQGRQLHRYWHRNKVHSTIRQQE
jgi:hypothetical protein